MPFIHASYLFKIFRYIPSMKTVHAPSKLSPRRIRVYYRVKLLLIFLVFSNSSLALCGLHLGQTNEEQIEYPAYLEYPFNIPLNAYPSMSQSLETTKVYYQLAHRTLDQAFGQRDSMLSQIGFWATIVLFDALTANIPLASTWLHEEWHRSVMSRYRIASYDEVYEMKLFSNVIKVSHVKDSDLSALKRDHNPDFVRLAEAGGESTMRLSDTLQIEEFLYNRQFRNIASYWLNVLQFQGYIQSSTETKSIDELKADRTSNEKSEKAKDFVGHDYLSWVYDLHRPDEPYEQRGILSNGAGVDRYREIDMLTDEEKKFIKLQGDLTWLNYADPFLFGMSSFGSDDLKWNVNFRHDLTSFGYAISGNWFMKSQELGMKATLIAYHNAYRWFPGLMCEFYDIPLNEDLRMNISGGLWEQAAHQKFFTRAGTLGAYSAITLKQRWLTRISIYSQLLAKTQGWLSGNPYLDRNISVKLGLEFII